MRLAQLSMFGVRPPRGTQGPLGSQPITLSQLAPYQTTVSGGYTKFANVPWGPCFGVASWNEPTLGGALTHPVMDIYYDPRVPAPPGGRTVIVRAHANGNTKDIPEQAGSSLWDYLVLPAMPLGAVVVTIEFRHPVANEALGVPHNDAGYCVQFVRAMTAALQLNASKVHGMSQSRGNLLLWSSCAFDLSNPSSNNYAKQQSSWLKSLWGVNTQSTYNTEQYINTFMNVADRAAALADPQYTKNPAFGSAYDKILAAERAVLPALCIVHDNPYVVPLPSPTIGTYPKATIDSDDGLRVHLPEFGKHLLSAYTTRGQEKNIAIADSVNGGRNTYVDAIPWFFALDDNPGITAREARTMVLLRRLGGSMQYVPEDGSGVYVSGANQTLVTTLGDAVGAMPDGSYGYANRANPTPAGSTYKQTTSSLRPKLAALNSGTRRGLAFDTDDVMPIFLASGASVDCRTWTAAGEVVGTTTRTATRFEVGPAQASGAIVAMVAAIPDATFDTLSLKFLRQHAQEISGVSYA